MMQAIFDRFSANLGTISGVAGFIASFVGGAYSIWLWADSDRKLRIAEVELLEGKLSRARTQASEYQAALDAAQRDIKECQLAAVLEQHDKLFKQGECERAAAILKEFFARERHNLGRVASELGDWYGQFIGDEGGGSAIPLARRFYRIATLAVPENRRWRSTAEELKLVADMDTLNQGQLPADADEFDDHFAFAAGSRREDAMMQVSALTYRSKALGEEGRYQAAYLLARRAYHIAERKLEERHEGALAAQDVLAWSLWLLGHYDEALRRFQDTLDIREKVLGAEDIGTARSLFNVAAQYQAQSRYDAAEPLYCRALAICEKVQGSNHPDTASTINNLAGIYEAQGSYDAAEPLYRRALIIRQEVLGSEHSDIAESLNNLATFHVVQGRLDAAEPLVTRALEINEKVVGAEHPNTARSLGNLALLYRAQGRYDAAEPLIIRALAIREKALGGEHPDTAASLNNLAAHYRDQGRYDAAAPLLIRALAIREKRLGADHPDTATSLNNLAEFYRAQGRYDAAEPLFVRALAINEKALGADHPDTVTTRNNLAALREERAAAAGPIPAVNTTAYTVQVNFGEPGPQPEARPE